jgi:superfamily II DNA or RNA helicase
MIVGVIIAFNDKLSFASLPTGSGKTWILLMLGLHYRNSLILVPNETLKRQMQE